MVRMRRERGHYVILSSKSRGSHLLVVVTPEGIAYVALCATSQHVVSTAGAAYVRAAGDLKITEMLLKLLMIENNPIT